MFLLLWFGLSRIGLVASRFWVLLAHFQGETTHNIVAPLWSSCWGIFLDAALVERMRVVRVKLACVVLTLWLRTEVFALRFFFRELSLVIWLVCGTCHTVWLGTRDLVVAWEGPWEILLLGAPEHTAEVRGCMCGCYRSGHWLLGGSGVWNLVFRFWDEIIEALFGPLWNSRAVLLALIELACLIWSQSGLRQRRCRGTIHRISNCILAVIAIYEAKVVKCAQRGARPIMVWLDP